VELTPEQALSLVHERNLAIQAAHQDQAIAEDLLEVSRSIFSIGPRSGYRDRPEHPRTPRRQARQDRRDCILQEEFEGSQAKNKKSE
jgi:hypothetical protein